MPRIARIDFPGLTYHVMFRGYNRMNIFHDDQDRKELLSRITAVINYSKAKVYAWVLMDNHVHLLLKTHDKTKLATIMQRIKGGYSGYFNRKYRRTGTIYDGRYKSTVVEEEDYLLRLVRYIHLNPYRAGMVKDLKEMSEYRWSGHRAMISRKRQPFHDVKVIKDRFNGRKDYLQFIQSGMKYEENLEGGGLRRSLGGLGRVFSPDGEDPRECFDSRILGSGMFVQEIWEKLDERGEQEKRIQFHDLAEMICGYCKVDIRKVMNWRKQKGTSEAKSLLVSTAIRVLEMSGADVGRKIKLTPSRISQLKYAGEELLEDRRYASAITAMVT